MLVLTADISFVGEHNFTDQHRFDQHKSDQQRFDQQRFDQQWFEKQILLKVEIDASCQCGLSTVEKRIVNGVEAEVKNSYQNQ